MPCEPQRTCHCTDGEQRGSPFPRSTQPVSPAVWLLPPTRSWVLPGGVIPHAVLLTQYMPGSVWGSRQDRPTTPRGGGGEQAEAVSSEPLLAGTGSAPPALDRVPRQTGRRVGARYSFHVRVRGPCHRGLSVLWVDAACAGGVRLYVLSGVVAACVIPCACTGGLRARASVLRDACLLHTRADVWVRGHRGDTGCVCDCKAHAQHKHGRRRTGLSEPSNVLHV